MNDPDTEEEITQIRETLQNFEDGDDGYLSEDLKELRHVVMFAHYRIERSLEVLLVVHIRTNQPKIDGATGAALFWASISPVFTRMEFWPKMDACIELNLIEGDLVSKIERINTLRKWFSHPASYRGEIMQFKDRRKYLEAIRQVKSALDALNDIFKPMVSPSPSPSPSPSQSEEDMEKSNIVDIFDTEVIDNLEAEKEGFEN